MNKKKDIFILILVLLIILIISGFFLFWPKEKKPELEYIARAELVGGYEILENGENKIVENKEHGLSILFPKDWKIRNNGKAGIGAFSPEVEFNGDGGFLESARETGGCIVGVEIRRAVRVNSEIETDVEYLMIEIESVKNGTVLMVEEKARQEIADISEKEALKTTYLKKGEEVYVKIEIPVDNIIYTLSNGMIFSKKCIGEFNKILDTVVINK